MNSLGTFSAAAKTQGRLPLQPCTVELLPLQHRTRLESGTSATRDAAPCLHIGIQTNPPRLAEQVAKHLTHARWISQPFSRPRKSPLVTTSPYGSPCRRDGRHETTAPRKTVGRTYCTLDITDLSTTHTDALYDGRSPDNRRPLFLVTRPEA